MFPGDAVLVVIEKFRLFCHHLRFRTYNVPITEMARQRVNNADVESSNPFRDFQLFNKFVFTLIVKNNFIS